MNIMERKTFSPNMHPSHSGTPDCRPSPQPSAVSELKLLFQLASMEKGGMLCKVRGAKGHYTVINM